MDLNDYFIFLAALLSVLIAYNYIQLKKEEKADGVAL